MDQRRDEPGLRSESIRRANLSTIARELHTSGSLSRSTLGARTGLTRSSIRALIGEFCVAGLVSEAGPAALGTPGRPSVVVTPNSDRPTVLALEIAVDSIAGAVVGFGGEIRQKRRVERPRGHLSLEQTVEDLAALARSLDAFHGKRGEIAGVGVAIAGVVRRADGFVSVAPNLGWGDVALGPASATPWAHSSRWKSPTKRTWGRSPKLGGERRAAFRTSSSSRARWEWAAVCSSTVTRWLAPPATAARSVICRSTRKACPVTAAQSAAGRPRSGRMRC